MRSAAQTAAVSQDKTILKATITNMDGQPMSTEVRFQGPATQKPIVVKPNPAGQITVTLTNGTSYSVTIAHSNDSYDYDVPETSISPTETIFKFNPKPAEYSIIAIRLYNQPPAARLEIGAAGAESESQTATADTLSFRIEKTGQYFISMPGVQIKNNKFFAQPGVAYGFLLRFDDSKHATLQTIESNQAILDITYVNLNNEPVPKETIIVRSKTSGREYSPVTNIAGKALLLLPANDTYTVSLFNFPNVFEQSLLHENDRIATTSLSLKYPSKKEYANQRNAELTAIKTRDSLFALRVKDAMAEFEKWAGATSSTSGKIAQKSLEADTAKKELAKDPAYFEKTNKPVAAVLYRFRVKWKYKIIVTDVTASMLPYMKEVVLWHMLEMMDTQRSDYAFFNDGDGMPDRQKVIGNTGGIYFNRKDADEEVFNTMLRAQSKGDGGDAAENDIEALLKASKDKDKNAELILVADNLSPVKDMSLLDQLKTPVRVILCSSDTAYVNPDYLEIAYKTKGSVHTIAEDIMNLGKLHNDEEVAINGRVYKFMNGKFFPVRLSF